MRRTSQRARVLLLLASVWPSGVAWAETTNPVQFEPKSAWPLCGRIAEHPPPGWVAVDGCPADRHGSPEFSDAPLSHTFGPRQLVSEGYRYDFHRGLDLATPIGTPVFAIAPGIIKKAGGHYSEYEDPLVQIRHYRPGAKGCRSGGGCYVSNYMHLSSWALSVGERVETGQLVGFSGASRSGFAHLHFEIRNAPPEDPYSNWQRDTVHPLLVLPYGDTGASNMLLAIDKVDGVKPILS